MAAADRERISKIATPDIDWLVSGLGVCVVDRDNNYPGK